jgi:sugar (pentulose or hexulose) kinase
VTSRHTAGDLARSIVEGIVFNIAYYVEILQDTSRRRISSIVISGNGFGHSLAAASFAAAVHLPVLAPARPGLATLCGAGICALRGLGVGEPSLTVTAIEPLDDPGVLQRYGLFKELRKRRGTS